MNSIWNHTSTFRIAFVYLAFLRISVCDSTNGRYLFSSIFCKISEFQECEIRKSIFVNLSDVSLCVHFIRCLAQRVVPVRCIRAGYRHLPLRTPTNTPMDQGTIFLYSRFEQEEHIYLHDEDSIINCDTDQQLHPQTLNINPV